MSKETLDYSKLCPNYYTSWEDGCCMETCTFNDLDECPIRYVEGLLEEKNKKIADLEAKLEITKKALELACKNVYDNEFIYVEQNEKVIKELINFFKTKAKEIMKSE